MHAPSWASLCLRPSHSPGLLNRQTCAMYWAQMSCPVGAVIWAARLLRSLHALRGHDEVVADRRADLRGGAAAGGADDAHEQPERRLLPAQQRDGRAHDAAGQLRLCPQCLTTPRCPWPCCCATDYDTDPRRHTATAERDIGTKPTLHLCTTLCLAALLAMIKVRARLGPQHSDLHRLLKKRRGPW